MEPVHQPVEVPGTDRKASPTLPRAGVLVVGRLVFFCQGRRRRCTTAAEELCTTGTMRKD